jgi:hypothetical protein
LLEGPDAIEFWSTGVYWPSSWCDSPPNGEVARVRLWQRWVALLGDKHHAATVHPPRPWSRLDTAYASSRGASLLARDNGEPCACGQQRNSDPDLSAASAVDFASAAFGGGGGGGGDR